MNAAWDSSAQRNGPARSLVTTRRPLSLVCRLPRQDRPQGPVFAGSFCVWRMGQPGRKRRDVGERGRSVGQFWGGLPPDNSPVGMSARARHPDAWHVLAPHWPVRTRRKAKSTSALFRLVLGWQQSTTELNRMPRSSLVSCWKPAIIALPRSGPTSSTSESTRQLTALRVTKDIRPPLNINLSPRSRREKR